MPWSQDHLRVIPPNKANPHTTPHHTPSHQSPTDRRSSGTRPENDPIKLDNGIPGIKQITSTLILVDNTCLFIRTWYHRSTARPWRTNGTKKTTYNMIQYVYGWRGTRDNLPRVVVQRCTKCSRIQLQQSLARHEENVKCSKTVEKK